jgi:NAD(P)H dehydrogenase (quinone)
VAGPLGASLRYLIVYAHPERRSLNGALKDHAVAALKMAGHEVQVSDLYAMRFKAVADGDDFPARETAERLTYHRASGEAFAAGTQSPDIAAEQHKLLWADIVVLQFPLWWFSVPAILKGWLDRVFAHGFAIGVPKPGTRQWQRYGEGTLAGRRAMLAVTTGGRAAQFGPRGINGAIDDVLFWLNHGVFHYTGMTPLEPFAAFQTVRISDAEFAQLAATYVTRLLGAATDVPIAYRSENGGDYDTQGVLLDGQASGRTGFAQHRQEMKE